MIQVINQIKNKVNAKLYNAKLQRQLIDAQADLNKPRSVIFYTTHKCASTFIKRLFEVVLKTSNSKYEIVDYASAIFWAGERLNIESPYEVFLEQSYSVLYSLRGKVYGPQRKYLDFPGRNNFKHIFFLRDPRDVLVSNYFSMGFIHREPLKASSRDEFMTKREAIKEKGIDKHVLDEAEEWIKPLYTQYKELRETSISHLYLKYDLFVENPREFINKISNFLEVYPSEKDIDLLVKEASPIQKVEVMKHKRSGKTGQYLEKLNPSTVEKLNCILKEVLHDWNFIKQ